MRARMSRYVQDGERRGELRNVDLVALAHGMAERGDRLALRPVHRHALRGDELSDAAGVVGMMVRGEDRDERELLFGEIGFYRTGLAGIDDRGVTAVAQRPDVVVAE